MGGSGKGRRCGERVRKKANVVNLDNLVLEYKVLKTPQSWTAAALLKEYGISVRDLKGIYSSLWS